jgi:hypothetical protein
MHVVIVGGGVGMASVGPQDGAIAPYEAWYHEFARLVPHPYVHLCRVLGP